MIRSTNQDDEYWLKALSKGNDQAFNWFFDLHNKSLSYFAARLLQDPDAADEIVSDCFLKLWQRRADFATPLNLKAFLFISCRNACLNYLEKLKVRNAAQHQYMLYLQQNDQTILNEIVQADVLDLVNREIEALPDKIRTVFKLLYIEGKTTAEIADELLVSVQTVRNQKTRAIELIKNSLLKKGVSTAVYLAFLFFLEGK
jgi:RNA polymerase sigma-70 factor (ECF subfamily)